MLDFNQLRLSSYVKLKLINAGIKCLSGLFCVAWLNVAHAQAQQPNLVFPQPSNITNSADTDAYTLGPGDLLRVDILDVPEYSGEYLILNDGSLTMPLIGRLNVAGLTVSQLTNLITTEYTPFVQQPFATVSLLSPRPLSVVVAGEVLRPGSYVIPLLVPNSQTRQFQFFKVTQLLQQAGGVTQLADISQIQIRRINPNQQLITVNLKDLLEQGNISQDVLLRDGDTIFVPKAPTFDPIAIRQLTSASFASKEIEPFSVVIVGEVFNPGTHQVGGQSGATSSQPPTITQAITSAGGITPLANIREIQLRRLTNAGVEEVVTINLWELLTQGDVTQDVALQPGDSITIPQAREIDSTEVTALARASFSPQTIQVNVVGEVIRPGAVNVAPDTTLNQAILAAGGFDQRRANKEIVELIRLNPNGTVSRRNIPINLEAGINEATNPILKRDDVIVVSRSGGARFGDSLEEALKPFGGIIGISSVLNVIQFWSR